MADPEIISYLKPLSVEDRKTIGTVNLADWDFYIGVDAYYDGDYRNIPANVGSFRAYQVVSAPMDFAKGKWQQQEYEVDLVKCSEIIPAKFTMHNSEATHSLCLDSNDIDLTVYKDSNHYADDQIYVRVGFEICQDGKSEV